MSLSPLSPSRPDRWLAPRQSLDPSMRLATYGKIRPMDEDRPFWRRLLHIG